MGNVERDITEAATFGLALDLEQHTQEGKI
jgi:hypothetical protein